MLLGADLGQIIVSLKKLKFQRLSSLPMSCGFSKKKLRIFQGFSLLISKWAILNIRSSLRGLQEEEPPQTFPQRALFRGGVPWADPTECPDSSVEKVRAPEAQRWQQSAEGAQC